MYLQQLQIFHSRLTIKKKGKELTKLLKNISNNKFKK